MNTKSIDTVLHGFKNNKNATTISLVLAGVFIGIAGCYLVIAYMPTIRGRNPYTIENDPVLEQAIDLDDENAVAVFDSNEVEVVDFSNTIRDVNNESIVEEENVKGQITENKKNGDAVGISVKKEEMNNNYDNVVSDSMYKELVTSQDCNLRSGPGVSYDTITVVPSQSIVNLSDCVKNGNTPWYRVTLDDGTEGYISGRCLSDLSSEIETTSASLSISMCPTKVESKDENISTIKTQVSPDIITETQSLTTNQPLIIEVPNEKYDYRPGDYHGELSQFMGKTISEVQSAFPSFTHNPYGDSKGNLYDNFWTTVEFRYKDNSVNQIVISQCDPSYSLMGISVGMDAETARSVLAAQGYPFDDPFQDYLGYWMHSADDHYEVEVDIYEGRVMTMMLLDLTKVDPWWKNNGILY